MPSDSSEDSDAKLLARAVRGDARAFGDLYDRYLDQVYRYVYYRVADQFEAEDLTEMVFLKTWESLARIRKPGSSLRAWLFRIAHNLVVDHHRTKKQELSFDQVNALRDTAPMPEAIVQSHEEGKQLASAIAQLEPNLQQVLVCRFISGLSHLETAQIMELSEGYVRVLQYRALRKMQKLLEEDVDENE